MITRIVKLKLKEEFVDGFLKYMEKFAQESREFKNNHHVDYFADMDESTHFHIYTIWKTEGALNKFRKSEINLNFKANIKEWNASPYTAWTVQNVREK